MRFNHWLYVAIVLFGAIGLSASAEMAHEPVYLVVATLLVAAFTYPAGLAIQAISFPLIYIGVATPAEALALSAPLCALLGYLQWYVLFPRLFGRSRA